LYVILKKTKEMKFIIIILTVLFPFISKGQTEFLDQIKIYKINDPKLKEITYKPSTIYSTNRTGYCTKPLRIL